MFPLFFVIRVLLSTWSYQFDGFYLQDGFAPPEEVDGDVPPPPNEEEEY